MTKIDIVSGFLGAGKTTLIKKLLSEVFAGTKVVLIENEFGEIGIDGGFLKESGIEIREMNAGCICCSLVGDFGTSLKEVMETYAPERILIEPSGVGKLSDVMRAINDASEHTQMHLNSAVAVVDASKCKVYLKNFGEFFDNQIAYAGTIILSRTDKISQEKIDECVELLRALNKDATIITTPISQLDGKMILDTIEGTADLQKQLLEEVLASDEEEDEHEHHHDEDEEEHEHHHHHHDEDEEEHEHHHHHHDEDEEEHEHHHHHHDEDEEEHEHHHHHDEDEEEHEHHHHHEEEEEESGVDEDGDRIYHTHDYQEQHGGHHHHHHHHHHHGHDADEVFGSWGMETPSRFTADEIRSILKELENEEKYGYVLRSKGMVPAPDGTWIHFDYVPEESEVRTGAPDVTGKICVIGAKLDEAALEKLFKRK
ncbi:Cobalamin synthesis protein cobW C-terminal domain-containing protein [Sarcina sp. DSM 11001]|uniref:CobW family GTP-binding protein n=1 Tax=Sarcina sp. DSM 11001 TaxID=1798184 RepID=UPI000889A41A|nr:CobW family GTP-binding protein [Sarcina sp. DSM 11001]SDK98265.1 Cobalamin synthesis protein cobW C-terminal domain-containing protein [Sarcina sp. DSM 11001]